MRSGRGVWWLESLPKVVKNWVWRNIFKAYHKNHINKVMMTAFTAFAFEDLIENGGRAIKLGVFRAQPYKVAEKVVRESMRQEDAGWCNQTKKTIFTLWIVV